MKTQFTTQQLANPAMASSEQAIRKCVHCGFCTATCPTYVLLGDERDSPRGRIYLMKEMLENEQRPTAEVVQHIDRCLSCLACMTTCPSGVNYMHLVDHSRAYVQQHYRRPVHERVLRCVLANVLPYRTRLRWALRVGRLVSPLVGLTRRFDALAPVSAMLDLAKHSHAKRTSAMDTPARGARRGRVLMMQGCAESVVRPQIREATIRLLNRVGYDVVFAPQEQCCGALTHHMGRETESLAMIRRTVNAWTRIIDAADANLDAIIITTSGCGTLIKDYGFVLRNDPEYAARAMRVSSLAKDISEFLSVDDVRSRRSATSMRVAYHGACSLQHGQKIVAAPKQLLEAAGFEVSVPSEAHLCCGSAGTYNILQPQISQQLARRKVDSLAVLKADVIATGNVGCAVQIGAYADTPVVHVVELLDWATGGLCPESLCAYSNKPENIPNA